MTSGQDRVDPAAAQREPVLEQDLDVAQASLDQIAREHRNAAIPRARLARRRPRPLIVQHLLEHDFSHTAAAGHRGQAGSRATDQRQGPAPTQHEKDRAGGGMSGSAAPQVQDTEARRAAVRDYPTGRKRRRMTRVGMGTYPSQVDRFVISRCISPHRIARHDGEAVLVGLTLENNSRRRRGNVKPDQDDQTPDVRPGRLQLATASAYSWPPDQRAETITKCGSIQCLVRSSS